MARKLSVIGLPFKDSNISFEMSTKIAIYVKKKASHAKSHGPLIDNLDFYRSK